jgi:hypothetical protein
MYRITSEHLVLAEKVFSSIRSSVRINHSDIYSFAADHIKERDLMLDKNQELEHSVEELSQKIHDNFENQYYSKDYRKLTPSDIVVLNTAFDVQISKINQKKVYISALTKEPSIIKKLDDEILELEKARQELLVLQN